jgi:hypothetical protein
VKKKEQNQGTISIFMRQNTKKKKKKNNPKKKKKKNPKTRFSNFCNENSMRLEFKKEKRE